MYKIDKSGDVVADMTEEVVERVPTKEEIEALEKKKKLQQINLFSKQVVDRMVKEGVPPSPANFQIYFEKYFEDKSPAQKEAIENVLKYESKNDLEKEYLSKVDFYLNNNFDETKILLDNVNTLYNKSSKIISFIKTKGIELAKNPTQSKISSFEKSISSAVTSLEKEQESIKDQYLDISRLMKEFKKDSIFDKKYEVYNKKYFFDSIKVELESIKIFPYPTSIIAFRIKENVLKDVKLQSDKNIIINTVAKMILDRSRRSDILAHYEDGIFLIMLKHTNSEQASRAVDSIKEYVSFSNFIIDGKQIRASIDTFILDIDPNLSVDEIIGSAISGLLNA